MAHNYIVKYECPHCFKLHSTDKNALDCCQPYTPEEVYVCEVCGNESGDNIEIKECCEE